MTALRGLALLLLFQSAGEALSHGLTLPFPGPVVGMLLLVCGLFHPAVRTPVAHCADFLLAHLSLLFVPVGVGVMTHLALLQSYGAKIAVVIVLSTWAGLAATAYMLHLLRDKPPASSPPSPPFPLALTSLSTQVEPPAGSHTGLSTGPQSAQLPDPIRYLCSDGQPNDTFGGNLRG